LAIGQWFCTSIKLSFYTGSSGFICVTDVVSNTTQWKIMCRQTIHLIAENVTLSKVLTKIAQELKVKNHLFKRNMVAKYCLAVRLAFFVN
jgi:hypothetical protein